MTEPDSYTVLCARVKDNPDPVAGSTTGHCSRCRTPVWVAPTTWRIVGDAEFIPLCDGCLTPTERRTMRQAVHRGPVPLQVPELAADLQRRLRQDG
jgi:hypothetical protein